MSKCHLMYLKILHNMTWHISVITQHFQVSSCHFSLGSEPIGLQGFQELTCSPYSSDLPPSPLAQLHSLWSRQLVLLWKPCVISVGPATSILPQAQQWYSESGQPAAATDNTSLDCVHRLRLQNPMNNTDENLTKTSAGGASGITNLWFTQRWMPRLYRHSGRCTRGLPLRRWSALKHSPFLTSFTM